MPRELLLTAPRTFSLASYEDRALASNEIRADALVSGISHGTELSLYGGGSPFDGRRFDLDLRLFVDDPERATYPMPLGYEWVGVVIATGSEARELAVGDRIHLARPHRETQTLALTDETAMLWTALPQGLHVESATLLRSTAIALQAVHDAELAVDDAVAVYGLGTFGLLALRLARLEGAGWIAAVDPLGARRMLATSFGADVVLDPAEQDAGREIKEATSRRGVDVAIEFSGSYRALQDAMRSVRLGGRVVTAGFYVGAAGSDLRLGEEWHHNRLTLVSSMSGWGAPARRAGWNRRRLNETARDLLHAGAVDVEPLVTHHVPFERAAEAYDLIDRRPEEALRVVLTY